MSFSPSRAMASLAFAAAVKGVLAADNAEAAGIAVGTAVVLAIIFGVGFCCIDSGGRCPGRIAAAWRGGATNPSAGQQTPSSAVVPEE